MKIKIIRAQHSIYWYSGHVGKVYTVTGSDKLNYYTGPGKTMLVLKSDCRPLKTKVVAKPAHNTAAEMPSFEEVTDAVFGHCGKCNFVNKKSDFIAVKKGYEYIARHFGCA